MKNFLRRSISKFINFVRRSISKFNNFLFGTNKDIGGFILNPHRETRLKSQKLKYFVRQGFIKFGLWCGFPNIDYTYVHGKKERVKLGKNCSISNSIFNVISGYIRIGDNTIFGHGCMVLTGTHEFYNGKRGKLHDPPQIETPSEGRDIEIGCGCFIGSGAIILGNVNIGDNVIIGAGSVVSKDIPSNCFAAGVPARVIRYFDNSED